MSIEQASAAVRLTKLGSKLLFCCFFAFELLPYNRVSAKELINYAVFQTSKKIRVFGTIVNADTGDPIPGASVKVKDDKTGTSTNTDGVFTIDVMEDAILEVSHLGYQPMEVPVEGRTQIQIRMKPTTASLDQVVIVGYGKQKKESVVSAISTVKGEDLKFPGRNLSNNLAGQVSGLIAIKRNNLPGYDNAEFWIRGVSTFAGGTSPLVLVDGVPRSINDIETDEIETFSVLKDAAATAVYGAEGANGVVIITSKRGKAKEPVISFRTEHSINKPQRLPQFVNSDQYMRLFNEALINDGQLGIFSDSLIAHFSNNDDPDLYPNVDWIKTMLRKHTRNQRYTLNVRGGSEKAKYFVSGAYYGENGVFVDDPKNRYENNIGVQRFNLRSNIDLEVSKTTTVSVDLSGQYLLTRYPYNPVATIFRQMLITPPNVFPAVYSDGTISTFPKERDANMRNPYNLLVNSGYQKEWRSAIQSTVKLNQKLDVITNGLTYNALVSYDYDGFFSAYRAYNPSRYYATGRDADGKLVFQRTFSGSEDLSDPAQNASATKKVYIENALNYKRVFDRHDVGAMVLYMQKETQFYNNALAFKKQGLVGRLTYSFDKRYFLEGNFGYTGSETFAKGFRFGFFPAIGLSYIVSNEDFYPDALKDVMNSFKVRLSMGRTGNDNTGGARFLYRPTFNFGASGFSQGITSGGGANGYGNGIIEGRFEAPYLSWEIEIKRNVGLDISFLKNKINLVADYFSNERTGILLQRRTVPGSAGFRDNPWQNYGKVKAWGFDASLDGRYPFSNDFSVSLRSTFTFTRNKVTEYDELPQKYPWMAVTGTRVSENTLYIAERLYTEEDFYVTTNSNGTKSYTLRPNFPISTLGGILGPGDIKYVDLNGDGKIDQFDRKRGVGSPYVPEIVYGFGVSVNYKQIYASVFFQGVAKSSVILGNGTGWMPFEWGWDQSNYRSFALDRWQEQNASTYAQNNYPFMPRIHSSSTNGANNMVNSTWWLRSGNFLRLKNAEVGYNIPKSVLDKLKLKPARVYFMGQNLAIWDHIKIWDPETGNGTAGNSYPNNTTYTIGLELSF